MTIIWSTRSPGGFSSMRWSWEELSERDRRGKASWSRWEKTIGSCREICYVGLRDTCTLRRELCASNPLGYSSNHLIFNQTTVVMNAESELDAGIKFHLWGDEDKHTNLLPAPLGHKNSNNNWEASINTNPRHPSPSAKEKTRKKGKTLRNPPHHIPRYHYSINRY